jgi:hypothetical protein
MELDDIDLSSGSKGDEKIRNVYSMTEAIKRPAPIQTPNEWESLEWFFERPWFSRIWIVQEAAFAAVVMYIGSLEIGWKEVAIAATWIWWNMKQPPQKGLVNIYSRAGEIFEQRTKRGAFLEGFLAGDLMKYSNATDPRDKIYALLGLMHDSERGSPLLQPDYSKSVERVYGDVVRQLLRENKHHNSRILTADEAWRY